MFDKQCSLPAFGDPFYSKASENELALLTANLLKRNPVTFGLLRVLRELQVPDSWLVSGAIYQNIWNALSGLPHGHGLKDYDLIYFDDTDCSWEAEDVIIRQIEAATVDLKVPVETRNQARVHLWYPDRFGSTYPKLGCAVESLNYYASRTHSVAARLCQNEEIEIVAPYGLANIYAMRLVPNLLLDNSGTYAEKGERMRKRWPLLTVEPWPVAQVQEVGVPLP
ncbi:nucleotidyltransferase family protein [Polycladidibacter hongkongensis]|uniref:nucleotidyltransferase family protein n=1 Tax=Polycladidibacter hongkongensis TaxID=1647556 RepID=UPI000829B9A1|nr:nucleotidyltransferase family protein [Pseudovibrio hongkongensis]